MIVDFDDLTSIVRPAGFANEMRPLRLVALRALDGRYRIELPVSRTAAARFTARRLPLEVCHDDLRSNTSTRPYLS